MMVGVWRCVLVMVVVMCACLCGYTEAVGGAKSRPRPQRRKPKTPKVEQVVDELLPTQNIDLQQMTGKWYLLNIASKCPYLIKHGTKIEPTVMTLSRTSTPDKTLSVSTKTRHNHQCWEILQVYNLTPTPGRLILNGTRPERNTEISIKETDYTKYAIIYYRKFDKVTMKYYSRVTDDIAEPLVLKFDEQAEKQGFGLAYQFPVQDYKKVTWEIRAQNCRTKGIAQSIGRCHCGDTDKDHIINCVPTC